MKRAAYAQLSMVSDTLDQIDDAPMPELRDKLIVRLRRMWGKDGHRTSLIHIENVNTAFIHETVRTLDTPEVRKVWPYWTFDAVMDDRTSHHCEALDGVVRPAGEAWWYDGHIPPLHFGGCRSIIAGLSLSEAHRKGVTPYYPIIQPDYGFGRMDSWEPDISGFPPELVEIYQEALRRAEKSTAQPAAAVPSTRAVQIAAARACRYTDAAHAHHLAEGGDWTEELAARAAEFFAGPRPRILYQRGVPVPWKVEFDSWGGEAGKRQISGMLAAAVASRRDSAHAPGSGSTDSVSAAGSLVASCVPQAAAQ